MAVTQSAGRAQEGLSGLPPLVAVVGTTASGKSDLAVQLASRIAGEVVSADSRQVYRQLDLGSGKLTVRERDGVPHHLLDVADVRERFTVSDYQTLAFRAVAEIRGRARVPILAGGTGLYVRAVIDNPAYPDVAPDAALRAELEARPLEALVQQLRAVDPDAAAALDLQNPRRVVRALEVTLSSGVPFSRQRRVNAARVRALQLGLTWPRDELARRIDARVEARLARRPSMLDEVRGLLDEGVRPARMLELGLEYRFLTRHLLGELGYDEMVGTLKRAIRQFARRQLTWFRRDPRIRWLDAHGDLIGEAESLARAFLERSEGAGAR